MLAELGPDTTGVVVAIIGTLGLVGVAGMNLRSARASRHRIEEAIDTGNGTMLGPTVYRLAGAVEVAIAQLHTNTRETIQLGADMEEHARHLTEHQATVRKELGAQAKLVRDTAAKHASVVKFSADRLEKKIDTQMAVLHQYVEEGLALRAHAPELIALADKASGKNQGTGP